MQVMGVTTGSKFGMCFFDILFASRLWATGVKFNTPGRSRIRFYTVGIKKVLLTGFVDTKAAACLGETAGGNGSVSKQRNSN